MTRGIVKIDIGHGLPIGEGWALDVAARDPGERLRPLPVADYLPALRDTFRLVDRVLTAIADGLYDQLRTISEGKHALSDEAQVLRLLDRVRGMKP
jgi:hypothetical protein